MSKISFNIKRLRELKKLSQENLAEELHITRPRLGAYEEARNEPPLDILIRISDYFHISIDVLLKSDLRKVDLNSLTEIQNNRTLFPIIIGEDNKDKIEVITQSASAGYLKGYTDPEYMEQLPCMQLPFEVSGKHRSFPIRGDSMPPLQTGDYVVGKYLNSIDEIKDNSSYILLTSQDGIVYKRVQREADNRLLLSSDNPAYPAYEIALSDVLEIWEFSCSLKVSDRKNDNISLENMMDVLLSMKSSLEKKKS